MEKSIVIATGELTYHEKDGEVFFTCEVIGRHLGYSDPVKQVSKIYGRNKLELEPFSTCVKLTAVDGKLREQRVFSEEGVYVITMLARTEKARTFRAAVARLVKETRKRALSMATFEGFKMAIERFHVAWEKTSVERMAFLQKCTRYAKMGLTQPEIGKLMDCSRDTVSRAVREARDMGVFYEK